MLFNQREFHICVSSEPLACDKVVKLLVVEGFNRIGFHIEVVHGESYDRVQLGSTAYAVREVFVIVPDYIFFQFPSLE